MEVKIRSIITKEFYTTSHFECDKCMKLIKEKKVPYSAYDFKIIHTDGYNFPEGSEKSISTIDLCSSCALELMIDLKEKGYRINLTEI